MIWRARLPSVRGSPSERPIQREIRLPGLAALPSPRSNPGCFQLQRALRGLPAVCDGLGVELFFDERLVVPDQGPVDPQAGGDCALGQVEDRPISLQTVDALSRHYGFRQAKKKWKDLPENGPPGPVPAMRSRGGRRSSSAIDEGGRVYEGVPRVRRGDPQHGTPLPRDRQLPGRREEMERFQNNRPCGSPAAASACGPRRWR